MNELAKLIRYRTAEQFQREVTDDKSVVSWYDKEANIVYINSALLEGHSTLVRHIVEKTQHTFLYADDLPKKVTLTAA